MSVEQKLRDYLKRATTDLREANRRVRELEEQRGEPIAIVGMSCRYPGGVSSPAELWELVTGEVDAVTDVPADRGWDLSEIANAGALPVGGFLDGVSGFDAGLFGISPREALAMDPQQRLLLECSWEALESAGMAPTSLAGSNTGVYIGTSGQDYPALLNAFGGGEDIAGHIATGGLASVLSGRVAYVLGLEGPTISIDTACSSSLVALHQATQAIRRGECSSALVGGVAVMSTPGAFVEFARQGALGGDGRCKAFAEGADGIAWAEGVGMLVVERLSEARRAGHRVLAVVRGSAINSDGASNGLTAPNGPSQQRVITRALADAGLPSGEVDAVEAHGTGTSLGDPIEAQALLATYGQERTDGHPLLLGSLKSNLGHSQAAAGVAGVIKMVLAMRHGELPRTLHVTEPTTRVDWSSGAVELIRERRPWPETDHPRRAAVSSFGVSGTNAHVILEQGDPDPVPEPPADARVVPWQLSAADEGAVREQAERLRAHLDDAPAAVGAALATTRALLPRRAVAVGDGREDFEAALDALASGAPSPAVVEGVADLAGKVVFVFPGQGGQWAGMGRELLDTSPVFAEKVRECEAAFAPHLDWSVTAVLRDEPGTPPLEQIDVMQPALFAIMVGLAALWESYGVRPDAVIGHSQGEVAAAHVSGALSIEDAARVVVVRSREFATLHDLGGMLTVGLPPDVVEADLADVPGVSINGLNGPTSVVVGGEAAGLDELQDRWTARGARWKRIPVEFASHTPQVAPVRDALLADLACIEPRTATIPFHSTVTGTVLDGTECDAEYWYSNVLKMVRFEPGIGALIEAGHDTFIEIGPKPIMTMAIQESLEVRDARGVVAGSLRREEGGLRRFLASAAEVFVRGARVDWTPAFGEAAPVPLPTYAFQHRPFWPRPSRMRQDATSLGLAGVGDHAFLGAAIGLADGGWVLSGRVAADSHQWLADHAVGGSIVFPGAGFVDLALRAGEMLGCDALSDLTLVAPLVLPERGGVRLQVVLTDHEIAIHSRAEDAGDGAPWVLHATGTLDPSATDTNRQAEQWPPEGAETLDVAGHYPGLAEAGIAYGPMFQGLTAAWRHGGDVFLETVLPQGGVSGDHTVHPALLDAALQGMAFLADGSAALVPFSWDGVTLGAVGAERLRVRLSAAGTDTVSLVAVDDAGELVLSADAVTMRPVRTEEFGAASAGEPLLEPAWTPVELPEPSAEEAGDGWRVLGEDVFGLADRGFPGDVVAVSVSGGDPYEQVCRVLSAIQDAVTGDDRLVVVTRGAMGGGDPVDLAGAAVWGLARSAATENPGRVTVVDADEASLGLLPAVLASDLDEAVLRDRVCRTLRLAKPTGEAGPDRPLRDGTVLITGGTGDLGTLLARHLVTGHGARDLLLLSRTGRAPELEAELTELGANVRIRACDVSDRDALAEVIAEAGPIGAVFHAAGVVDDAVITGLTPDHVARTLATKLDGARWLHELTESHEPSHFVLFSSVAGLLGSAGQGNHAAANAALDAFAEWRQGLGLPATSLAWGPWEGGTVGKLSAADIARMGRSGMRLLTASSGMALLDASLSSDHALLVPVLVGGPSVVDDQVPPLLRGILRPARRKAARRSSGASGGLAAKLARVPAGERRELVTDIVRGEVAAVLGHTSGREIDPRRTFKDLGFDSLTSVDLRNRLAAVTGLRLPATMVFDYPDATALAGFLLEGLGDTTTPVTTRAVVAEASAEPIAIIGMACRFPGADSPEALWDLVASESDMIGPFPTDRGWSATEGVGGFVHNATEFDAEFFGISPREALGMDPQQRLALECTWEALERAGIDPHGLRRSDTGVFVGLSHSVYQDAGGGLGEAKGFAVTGTAPGVASGRIAYVLGLEGPTLSVDTACSSSLVAVHLAVQSLRSGECGLAVIGGTAVMATEGLFAEFGLQGNLAGDGRVKAFADAADGTSWSEGAGILVAERLSEARRAGHPVLAVVRGSAVNSDGASNGLTAPNGPSQQRVIARALADAGVRAAEVDAVEAHGTGTTLGDPIEAQALLATYGQDRAEEPLWLGSVKSNLGHAQAAAGMAGLIKLVQSMRHGVLPRTLNVDRPSTHVDWSEGAVELLTETRAWPETGRARRGAVSAFGIGGTNAHVILEHEPEPDGKPDEGPYETVPLVLSARNATALSEYAADLRAALAGREDWLPAPLARHLTTTRSRFDHRAVLLAEDREGLLDRLESLATDGEDAAVVRGSVRSGGKTVFVFPGQGAQWSGMASGLMAEAPVFRETIEECARVLEDLVDWSLVDVLTGAEGAPDLEQREVVQPANFAMMVALARLWRHHGVEPSVVIGTSQGEIAAAHVAGALSLEDAARLIVTRSRSVEALSGLGGMATVALGAERTAEIVEPYGLSIAAHNGPRSTVVSGDADAVTAFVAAYEDADIRVKRFISDYASHSSQVERIRDEVIEAFSWVTPREGEIAFHSTARGERVDTTELTAEYWYENLRMPVRFDDGIRALIEREHGVFLEMSAHPVLALGIEETIDELAAPAVALGTLRRDHGGADEFRTALARAHAHGVEIDWETVFDGVPQRHFDVPTYRFQRRHYWPSGSAADAAGVQAAGLQTAGHPFLGTVVDLPGSDGIVFLGRISITTHPWLADHGVSGTVLLPGTAFVELATTAAARAGCERLDELTLATPLILPPGQALRLQITVGGPDEEGRRALEVFSLREDAPDGEQWTKHATGFASAGAVEAFPEAFAWPPRDASEVDVDALYTRAGEAGLFYGPTFARLRRAWRRGDEMFAEVDLAAEDEDAAGQFRLHPALFDASLHVLGAPPEGTSASDDVKVQVELPFSWTGVTLPPSGATAARIRIAPSDQGLVSMTAVDPEGNVIAVVDGLVLRPFTNEQLAAGKRAAGGGVLRVEWPAVDLRPVTAQVPMRFVTLDTEGTAVDVAVRALELVKEHEASEERLVLVTRNAVAADEGDVPDPVAAAAWGLVRSAQTEHPERFVLVDTDGDADVPADLVARAIEAGEPQLAVRGGRLRVPRLAVASAVAETPKLDPEGTVVITGGTGGLGARVARHLVAEHGVRDLLLLSRRGPDTPGVDELRADLTAAGARTVTVKACDVADRAGLADALKGHTPTAVVHSAAALDDGVIDSLNRGRIENVFEAKVNGAMNLRELTADADLRAFVLFSSAAGVLGGAGQANYAAANVVLDTLAQRWRAEGVPATSVAWGPWATATELMGDLGESGLARLAQAGTVALRDEEGLELFDRALSAGTALVFGARMDLGALRARGSALPAVFRGLVPDVVRAKAAAPEKSAVDELMRLDPAERPPALLALLRRQVAGVLGFASPDEVEDTRPFKEMGFDSLTAVELRNRLAAVTGLRLPPTLVFDYPTPKSVSEYLLAGLTPEEDTGSVLDELDRIEAALAGLGDDDLLRTTAMARMADLVSRWGGAARPVAAEPESEQVSDDDMFEMLGRRYGGMDAE